MFIDTSRQTIPSDRAETALLKPDFVLFETGYRRHWEHVRMPIEVKQKPTHHKAAMKQLARYARAVFAHQLHRCHLYATMICATEVTFVRFDRAGILYSPPIDLRKDPDVFTRAFASLLMLNRSERGYDPAFVCEMNPQGRLDYHVDLPQDAFTTEQPEPESPTGGPVKTYRFKVVDRLCHRRSISGRATIVLRIRRVDNNQVYILKIMWRDPRREPESDVLRKVKGKFGLAQYVWHSDASGPCRCSLQATGPWECRTCVAETPEIDKLEVCDNLTDLDIEVPPENEESKQELQLTEVDTSVRRSTSQKRLRRIGVFIVISSRGVPLNQAKSPHEFMEAVLDAILGYWELFNSKVLHRDISEGNVMLLEPGQQLERKCEDTKTTDKVLVESEEKLKQILKDLGREPTGMLSDYDLHSSVVPSTTTPVDAPRPMTPTPTTPTTPTTPIDAPIPDSAGSMVAITASASSRSSKNVRLREEDATEDNRESKKRKTLSRSDDGPENTGIEPGSGQKNEEDTGIDFRTGTPAFMSIRVIQVAVGQRYNHSFLDDIESFFWLILWMTAAHLDPGKRPTAAAQSMLNRLNQEDPATMADTKKSQLGDCTRRHRMKKTLREFGNSWARHQLFSDIIINFGTLADEYYDAIFDNKALSPLEVFPAVVGVFQKALYPQPASAAESA